MSQDNADPKESEYDKAFEPYAREIGLLVRDWNSLQQEFFRLFLVVVRRRSVPQLLVLRAIWNAVPHDRFQRSMLKEAGRARYADTRLSSPSKRDLAIFEGIEWAVEKADGLGRLRDDAVHVPLVYAVTGEFWAHDVTGHPIAVKLQYSDMIRECQSYREKINLLHDYVYALTEYLMDRNARMRSAWPQRPEWPSSPQSSGRKSRPRPKRGKPR